MEEQENEVIKEEARANSEATQKVNNNGMSIASMVLGIVGLIIFAVPCGILAIIFAVLAKKKGKNGMATAGLVLGIIDVAAGGIYVIMTMVRSYNSFLIII